MPLYEYQCDACGHRFEVIQKFSDPPLETCPKCGGAVRKLQSAPAFQFKGSGWYITDYAKKDQAAPARPSGGAKADGGESRGEKAATRPSSPTRRDEEPTSEKSARRPTKTDESRQRRQRASTAARRRSADSSTVAGALSVQRFPAGACRSERRAGRPRTCPPDRAAAARSTPPPSGTRACCRCRGGRP